MHYSLVVPEVTCTVTCSRRRCGQVSSNLNTLYTFTAAHWQSDTAFTSRYVPFNDVKEGRSSSETYSLDEVGTVAARRLLSFDWFSVYWLANHIV